MRGHTNFKWVAVLFILYTVAKAIYTFAYFNSQLEFTWTIKLD